MDDNYITNAWGECQRKFDNVDDGEIIPAIQEIAYGTIIFKYNAKTSVLQTISPIFFFQAHGFKNWELDSWLQFATSIDHSDESYEIGYGEDDVFCRIASIPKDVLHDFMNTHEIYIQDPGNSGWEDDYLKKLFMLVPDGFVEVEENMLYSRHALPNTHNHTIYTI